MISHTYPHIKTDTRAKTFLDRGETLTHHRFMAKKSIPLTAFGTYLKVNNCEYRTASVALDVTSSYISMLSRGPTKPGLKLALRIELWTKTSFGGDGFVVRQWA